METIFQSRRIRAQLKEQLDRHNEKPASGDGTTSDSTSSQTGPPAEKGALRDLEQGSPPLSGGAAIDGVAGTPPSRGAPARTDFAARRGSQGSVESVESVEEAQPQDGEVRTRQEGMRAVSHVSLRSQRTLGTALGHTLTGVDVRDRTSMEGGDMDRQVFVVGFEGDDDLTNPHNWSNAKKWKVTILVASIGLLVGLASSIDSSILQPAAKDFGVSQVAESLATGLYLIGFGFGSLFAGPFSETFGRAPVYLATMVLFCIWVMASGLAPNIGAQLVFRFIAGMAGAAPLTCAGGSLADIWNPKERTFAFPIFANAGFTGPVLGPIVGGFIAEFSENGDISWRWTEWVTLISAGAVLAGLVVSMPETFGGVLLSWKAKHLRELTGDDRYRAPLEIKSETLVQKMKVSLSRPFIMTFQEPIIIFITLYMTVIYIILFTFLDGYDYIFTEIHGTSPDITGLCFIGILVGLFGCSTIVWPVWLLTLRDERRAQAAGSKTFEPESRLWSAMLGGSFMIPISLFWMGWTSDSSISIWSPLVASVFFGWGILAVFISSYQYIIDTYEVYSASALVFVTLVRYVASGAMVVVGIPFYENLGVHYTLTILACLSALLTPLPYVLRRYGKSIRKRSKYAAHHD